MSFSFAKFLLNQTEDCNGHFQCEASGISIEDGIELCRELEELTDKQWSFTLEVWTCGGYTIYQMDYWKRNEHILGDVNRMVLSVNP